MEMKTAAQHNAGLTGSLELPPQPPLPRKESRESLEGRANKLTEENKAIMSLVQDLREIQAEKLRAVPATQDECMTGISARESMVNTGAILMPGGTRIILRHIQQYSPGGDSGIHFKLSDGGHIWNPPTASSIPGAEARRRDQQAQALAALDKLFNVETE